jgi:hypothetical protein
MTYARKTLISLQDTPYYHVAKITGMYASSVPGEATSLSRTRG